MINQRIKTEAFMKKKTVKKLIGLSLCLVLITGLLTGCGKKGDNSPDGSSGPVTEVTLNEVAHSIFYAPMYVAIEEGYFAKEGIDLTLVTGFGVIQKVQNKLKKIHVGYSVI